MYSNMSIFYIYNKVYHVEEADLLFIQDSGENITVYIFKYKLTTIYHPLVNHRQITSFFIGIIRLLKNGLVSHLWSNTDQESDRLATSLGALDRHFAHHNYVHSSLFERVPLVMILRCMYMCVKLAFLTLQVLLTDALLTTTMSMWSLFMCT